MSKENHSVDRLKKSLDCLWKDIKNARWVIIFIIAYFVFLKNFLYSTCPLVIFTGFPCPMCGMTRAGFALLHLEFKEAFHIHPFIYPLGFMIAAFCANRYIFLKKTPEWMKWCMIILLAAMTVFYIWRMYHYFPGEPPMSYYYNNLASRLRRWFYRFAGNSQIQLFFQSLYDKINL